LVVRVVIPTLNNSWLTLQAISALRYHRDPVDVVIIDNGSTDETHRVIRQLDDFDPTGKKPGGVRILSNPEVGEYSKSINMGAAASGDWDALIVLNNDAIVTPGAIEALCEELTDQVGVALPLSPRCISGMGVTPPRIERPTSMSAVYRNVESVATWWAGQPKKAPVPVRYPYVRQGGYAFAISRACWDALGGFDESYGLFAGDYDLFDRALRIAKIVQVRSAYIEHLEHQTVTWVEGRDEQMMRGRFHLTEQREGKQELVSVILPTYNRVDTLVEAVESVLRQWMPHWRLYVIDDGSGDWDRIMRVAGSKFSDHHNRIWWFHEKHNRGPGAARNRGLELARGKYIAFLDSDDIWYPNHLQTHLELHEHSPGLLMSYSETDFAWRWYDEKAKAYRYRPERHPEHQLKDWRYSPERLEKECFIKTSTVFAWAELFRGADPLRFIEDVHHREAQGAVEDHEMFKAIAGRGPEMIRHVAETTARTHWAKSPSEEAHHSSRLNPWAAFGAPLPEWTARLEVSPEETDISVVVPTRIRAKELARCLGSLSSPAVVVADGRESASYAYKLVDASDEHGLVVVEKASGPGFARNRGAEFAKSKWVWFLDDDDIALPGAIDLIRAEIGGEDVLCFDVLMSACEDGLRPASGLYTSGLVVKREALMRAGGFDEKCGLAEERELVDRMASKFGAIVKRIPRPIAVKTSSHQVGRTSVQGGASRERLKNPR